MRGLYIHIPFCKRKCYYCDFYSVVGKTELMYLFVAAVFNEAQIYAGARIDTLYLGGGTPSLLGSSNLLTLMDGLKQAFDLSHLCESTIEINPDTATSGLFEAARQCGFNRVSIGVQSLSDSELHRSGRVHDSIQALTALQQASETGFTNISVDIIIGLPGQSWYSLKKTLEILLETGITHLSAYCLSVEEGTPLAASRLVDLPDDDMQAVLYEKVMRYLKKSGLIHYEISNFCQPGMPCLHNLNYWRGGEYIGLGPAAASHINGHRFTNAADLSGYLIDPAGIKCGDEYLEPPAKLGEEAMLRLRLLQEGLDLADVQGRFDVGIDNLVQRLNNLVHKQSLVKQGSRYYLPSSRVLTSNSILAGVLD